MRFRPVSAQGGAATASNQFSIPTLPSTTTSNSSSSGRNTYEDLIRENKGCGGTVASATASTNSGTSSDMVISPVPPSSIKKTRSSNNNNKRSMLRSPLSFLSPNGDKSVGSRIMMGGGTSVGGNSVGSSARKLFTSPTQRRHRKKSSKQQSSSQIQLVRSSPAAMSNTSTSLSIYSPSPTKKGRTTMHSNTNINANSNTAGRASLNGSYVKGSLRKERKRHKSFANASSAAASGTKSANAHITTRTRNTHPARQVDDDIEAEDGNMNVDSTVTSTNYDEEEITTQGDVTIEETKTMVEFAYPTGDVTIPGPAVLEYFHGLATKDSNAGDTISDTANNAVVSPNVGAESNGTATEASAQLITHQVQLDTLGTKLLSLEDVLIPSIAHEENAALKRVQAKLQRDPETNGPSIQVTKEVRAFVMGLASGMAVAVKTNRLEREEGLRLAEERAMEEAKVAKEEARTVRRTERATAREERRARRALDKERARVKRKKNLPRNKELWREVAKLMTDLAMLQKEERSWDEAGRDLDKREVEMERMIEERKVRRQQEEEEQQEKEVTETEDCDLVKEGRTAAVQAETSVTNAIDDLTLSAGRINATLGSISDLMVESDKVRVEVYGKYRAEHQFHGYRGSRDTKGLIVALSQDC